MTRVSALLSKYDNTFRKEYDCLRAIEIICKPAQSGVVVSLYSCNKCLT